MLTTPALSASASGASASTGPRETPQSTDDIRDHAAQASMAASTSSRLRAPQPIALRPPSLLYPKLFPAVQMAKPPIYGDQKTFADAVPKRSTIEINQFFETEKTRLDFSIDAFVRQNFTPEPPAVIPHTDQPDRNLRAYIREGWDKLTIQPMTPREGCSRLPIPYRCVVPGGRFNEPNYWDMAFIMPGLLADGRSDLALDMLRNTASFIERYGHVPNGFRTYQLSRSQPPVFAMMVTMLADDMGDPSLLKQFLPQLKAEYEFFMQGAKTLAEGEASGHVVRLHNGTVLNRYWDDRAAPRDESYQEDVQTAQVAEAANHRDRNDVYRDLRAACESGWDFSARWFKDSKDLDTIRTTDILPVDLNCLMQNLEAVLAMASREHDPAGAEAYADAARSRADAIRGLMWDPEAGAFTDYLWKTDERTHFLSAATAFPLRFGIATEEQAHIVARTIENRMLEPGGMSSTLFQTGQQWDKPNGWAPLQDIAVDGLNRYGEVDLAKNIALRWVRRNVENYAATGVLVEKYNVDSPTGTDGGGGGGEYELQEGFGWTNGVLRKFIEMYPQETADILNDNPGAVSGSGRPARTGLLPAQCLGVLNDTDRQPPGRTQSAPRLSL